jgi:hypothetical protein
MIEQLSTFPDNVLAFVGRGQVTRADYDAVLVPARRHRAVRQGLDSSAPLRARPIRLRPVL